MKEKTITSGSDQTKLYRLSIFHLVLDGLHGNYNQKKKREKYRKQNKSKHEKKNVLKDCDQTHSKSHICKIFRVLKNFPLRKKYSQTISCLNKSNQLASYLYKKYII